MCSIECRSGFLLFSLLIAVVWLSVPVHVIS